MAKLLDHYLKKFDNGFSFVFSNLAQPMVGGYSKFLVPFYPMNTARVIFSSDSNMDPLNKV